MLPKNKFVNLQSEWDSAEIHFWNAKSKVATVVAGELVRNSITVVIPNEFIDEGLDINIFVFVTKGETSNTIAGVTIPITQRIEKEGEQP